MKHEPYICIISPKDRTKGTSGIVKVCTWDDVYNLSRIISMDYYIEPQRYNKCEQLEFAFVKNIQQPELQFFSTSVL